MPDKKHTHHSNRTRISGEIKNLNFEVDPREIRPKPETNAFIQAKELKKREKVIKAEAKYTKFHLANRKKLKSRWELEVEFTEDFPEEL
ncbi:MAG: hypothetical protein JW776_08045 [Candidatus Lokiarchaeota archaeon]|nr:hypothetical protein [Candidatus Lokiarchaeota archaeon]